MRSIININDSWSFIKDSAHAPTVLPEAAETVDLPHTWNAADGTDGGNDYFRGSCCYARRLILSEMPKADRYFLEINGANSSADVYMNGERLAHHDGGYSTWRVEITNALREQNCISVIVDNSANDTVYPQTADFTFYGGLYRDVNIIAVPNTHFSLDYFGGDGIKVTPIVEENKAKIAMEVYVTDLKNGDRIMYSVTDQNGVAVANAQLDLLSVEFIIDSPHLWDGRKDPYLYTAAASIIRDGEPIDTVSARFGCRSYEIDPQRGFILNGREYPLHGVSRHQDRLGFGNALLPEHHKEDMDLICEVGANTIRLAHYQHDRYFYDLCDKRGMIVWAEIPYISRHMTSGNENAESQLKELIIQNYNHPSVVVWGISNEITMDGEKDPDMLDNHRRLNDLAHELDNTRPTTMACLSTCGTDEQIAHITDVVSYNHYFGWYGGNIDDNGVWFDKFHEEYPNRAIGCSEYGCEALNWHSSNPKQGDYTEEYQAHYHEELIKQLFSRKYLWATHVWNMFDFGADARAEGGENGQNHKGLVTFDRKYKKDAFYAYKAWLSDEPFVHICGKRYIDRTEDVTKVTVYSNLPEVELFANGVTLGKIMADDHFFRFEAPNVGETALKAVAGECADEAMLKKVDEMNPDYVLQEQGAVLNWFDITEVNGRFSLNDTIGEINRTEQGRQWTAQLLMTIAKKQGGGDHANISEMGGGMMSMLDGLTVLRLTSLLGMRNVLFTKEELLDMNRKLNKISKPNRKTNP